MATKIVIPEVGESITSGVIAAWSVADGDYVERDQTVLELETDKITMEVPAPAAGILKHSAAEGAEVDVGSTVGEIDESAEKPASKSAEAPAKPEQAQAQQESAPKPPPAASTATAVAHAPSSNPTGPIHGGGLGGAVVAGRSGGVAVIGGMNRSA